MAKIELIQASPRVTPAGDIELDLKAALLKERFAEHGDEGIQVPNISFQVSLAQANTTPLPPRGIPEDGEVKHNAVATQPARRKLPDDICGHMRIEADRTLNRPTIVNDFRVVLNTVGATQPKSVCAFIAALINEMLALFDRSEIYAHPNRRRQFLAIAREALNQSTPEYSGLLSILSELEKSLDRRAEIGKVRTVTGWEPAPGSFDFDPTAITSRFDLYPKK